MQVEVFEQTAGLHGGKEVWVKALSNEVVDWPTVRAKLDDRHTDVIDRCVDHNDQRGMPKGYHPHLVTEEERMEHGYRYEDWWVFVIPKYVAL
jgi:hypothetical protein